MKKDQRGMTDLRFEIIIAMLNEDQKLYERLRFYLK
jgi:hypothetical protein